jgi:hypothetical protein
MYCSAEPFDNNITASLITWILDCSHLARTFAFHINQVHYVICIGIQQIPLCTNIAYTFLTVYSVWGSHSGGYEEFYLLGYIAVKFVESLPSFRRSVSPPSSGSYKLRKKPAWKLVASRAGLFYDSEDGGDMFLRNIGWLSSGYMVFYPRGRNSS